MITNYKAAKDDALKAYASFLSLANEVKQGKKVSYDSSLDTLALQAKNIKKNKFLLMIVGEAKSGKSTFINAYLGKEILPMDVKQCTSAIVDIRYGNKFVLKATYANNETKVFDNETKIREFLIANAALDDEFRDIPISIINNEILMIKDKAITEKYIADLLKGIESENIHNLSAKEYEGKVRNYIKKKKPVWKEIVKKIEIEYPFDDEDMKGIEIVDTPGVNAEGRVGDITNEYIKNANAVMFLKPLTGAALESTSFKKFLSSNSNNRNRDAIFLVLTRAANETKENVTRIFDEALKQFPDINEKQIIHIDSKVEIFFNQVKTLAVEELHDKIETLANADKLDSFLETPWYRSRCDRDTYLKKLKELSNFDTVDDVLNKFAHKAQYIALSEFLGRMVSVLRSIQDKLNDDIENNKLKSEDPIELENKLRTAQSNIDNLRRKINRDVDDIAKKYSKVDGIIEKRANEVIKAYKMEVQAIDPNQINSLDELEKISFRKIDIFTEFQEELQKNIIAECDEALIALSDKSAIKSSALKPDLTKEMIKSVKVEMKDKAYVKEYYITGKTFDIPHKKSKFSQYKYYKLVKDSIEEKIENIKDDAIVDLCDYVDQTATAYRQELTNNAKIKQMEYNDILVQKKTAEEIKEIIKTLESQMGQLIPMVNYIESLKGGVDKNV